MASRQVADILQTSQNIHNHLRDAIQRRSVVTADERLSTALNYLDQVQQKSRTVLNESLEPNHKKVLSTYIRYYPVEIEHEVLKIIDHCEDEDATGLMKTLIQTRQQLVAIYDICAENAQLPEVAELLENIREFETTQLLELGQQMTDYPFGR